MWTHFLASCALCHLALASSELFVRQGAQSCPLVNSFGCKPSDSIGEIKAPERRSLLASVIDLSQVSRDLGQDVPMLVRRAQRNPGAREADGLLQLVQERYAGTNDSLVDTINDLFARSGGRGEYKFCEKDAEMKYKTPGYPSGTLLLDSENWDACDNFKLVDNKPPQAGVDYIDEHILERQMLKHFFNNEFMTWNNQPLANEPQANRWDPKGSPVPGHASYCKYIEKFWNSDPAKNQIGGFDALSYVAEGYPSTAANGNEMVRLESHTNGLKATAFSPETAVRDVDKLREHFDVYDAKGNLKKNKKHVTIEDLGPVAKDVKLAIIMTKYMDHPTVNGYYKNQVDRVAIRMRDAEAHIAQAWGGQYVPQGLEGKWRAFMKEATEAVSDKVFTMVQLYKGFLDIQLQNAKTRLPQGTSLSKKEKDIADGIEKLVKEADALKAFKNPF